MLWSSSLRAVFLTRLNNTHNGENPRKGFSLILEMKERGRKRFLLLKCILLLFFPNINVEVTKVQKEGVHPEAMSSWEGPEHLLCSWKNGVTIYLPGCRQDIQNGVRDIDSHWVRPVEGQYGSSVLAHGLLQVSSGVAFLKWGEGNETILVLLKLSKPRLWYLLANWTK